MNDVLKLDSSLVQDLSESDLIFWLEKQDDLYENEGDSDVSDSSYDAIKRLSHLTYPANKYFTGVGSSSRGGKVDLAFPMLGLTQIYDGELAAWVRRYNAQQYIAANKLDGVSAQVIYDEEGQFQIAYSRGDGSKGADISRHIRLIPNIPMSVPATGKPIPVRMEIIIAKADFVKLQQVQKSRGGRVYKNARNAVAGIMNSSTNNPDVYQFLNGVAYTIIDSTQSKSGQFQLLQNMGFDTTEFFQFSKAELTETAITKLLVSERPKYAFEIDGMVIDIDEHGTKQQAIKYKVADDDNVAIVPVKNVIWRASKDGYLKPRVEIKPTELVGVTVTYATGFNAAFIRDNKIGKGAIIKITRSGDVIPFILGVVTPAPTTDLPDKDEHGDWSWNATKIDAVLNDISGRKDVAIKYMTDVFKKLGVEHFGEGNISKMFDAGFKTPIDVINADMMDFHMTFGANGRKAYDSMIDKLTGIYWPTFFGAMGTFGRGVGRKKLTKLYDAVQGDLNKFHTSASITAIEGFEQKTADKIVSMTRSMYEVQELVKDIVSFTTYTIPSAPKGNKMIGRGVCFTGVRSAAVEKMILEQGGEIKSGVSTKVHILVCKDPHSGSSKIKKAAKLGIAVMTLNDIEKILLS